MSNLKKALEYLDRGFSIIPLWSLEEVNKYSGILKELKDEAANKSSNEEEYQREYDKLLTTKCKAPLNVSWTYYQTNRPTKEEVVKWFTDYPDANIGIIAGYISWITVLDLDTQDAIDKANYAGILKGNPVSETGKGYHVFFLYSDDESAKTTTKKEYGFDIRNDRGYAVAPPSMHASGKHYKWIPGQSIFELGLNEFPVEYISAQINGKKNKINSSIIKKKYESKQTSTTNVDNILNQSVDTDILKANFTANTKELISHGNMGRYPSRSEADMAVVCELVKRGLSDIAIEKIFNQYPIGEKYRESGDPTKYLDHTIKTAKEKYCDLTIEEISNPLFTSNSITKNGNAYSLNIVDFQDYICSSQKIKLNRENYGVYGYSDKHYELYEPKDINYICQNILNEHRKLFGQKALNDFVHYMNNAKSTISKYDVENGKPYTCFNNCMLNIETLEQRAHTDDIFTTSVFDYDYDPEADCPRFKQFLNEVFEGDQAKIGFIQEAAGYCLHRDLPTPALVFLVGNGSNGKSVLIDVLTEVFGMDNVANVNLSELSKDDRMITLLDKMMNVSPESPTNKQLDSDKIKSVTAGDIVTGRAIYHDPFTFRPYAKHFIAMNEFPIIDDKSHGMSRRMFVLEFNRTFAGKEIDTGLKNKLLEELSGIFNFILEGYRRMLSNGFIFTDGQIFQGIANDNLHQDDPVREFIENYFRNNNSSKAKWTEIYSEYKGNYHNPIQKQKMKSYLIALGYKVENSTKDGNKVMVWNKSD